MKVLLINRIPEQAPLLLNVCKNIYRHGIAIDLFNFKNGLFFSNTQNKLSIFYRLYTLICHCAFIRKYFNRFFLEGIILKLAKKYDVIDFQGLFTHQYIHIIPKVKQQGQRVIITVWGSDFYRQAGGTWEEMTPCYESCDIIHIATEQMKTDFISKYPQFEQKMRVVHFGIAQLELLKELLKESNRLEDSFLSIPENAIVLSCGYNGKPVQQHESMIKALLALPIEMRNRLFILFPMTYGTPTGYIEKIESLLQGTKIRYKLFLRKLSLKELMTLRIKTNIAVNIQQTDAFAASIQEHIMAGNLLVVGDWLPYQILDENGIFVRRTSLEDLTTNIKWAIDNYLSMQEILEKNQERMYKLSSWNYVSEKWANIYQELAS